MFSSSRGLILNDRGATPSTPRQTVLTVVTTTTGRSPRTATRALVLVLVVIGIFFFLLGRDGIATAAARTLVEGVVIMTVDDPSGGCSLPWPCC